MPSITIAQIRVQYPAPMREVDSTRREYETCYCVGGAVLQAYRPLLHLDVHNWQFPGEYELADALRDINPELDADDDVLDLEDSKAMEFADDIITHNERGEFEDAWRLAEEALAYRHKEVA